MASVFNSLRNIASDNWWVVKIAILALPIFCILNNNLLEKYGYNDQIIFGLILSILYLGFVSVMMHRNINNKTPLMPGLFSIPEYIVKTIGMSIVSIPLLIIYGVVINLIKTYVVFEPFVMFVIYVCVTLFLAPFIFIPSVLYSVNGKITDAFNFKVIIGGAGNFSVAFLSYVIQYIFTIFLFAFLFYKLFTEMVNDSMLVNIVYSLTFVISILSLYSYFSDLYDEQIPPLPKKKKLQNSDKKNPKLKR